MALAGAVRKLHCLHWTDRPYVWHVNGRLKVFVVLDGSIDMLVCQDGIKHGHPRADHHADVGIPLMTPVARTNLSIRSVVDIAPVRRKPSGKWTRQWETAADFQISSMKTTAAGGAGGRYRLFPHIPAASLAD